MTKYILLLIAVFLLVACQKDGKVAVEEKANQKTVLSTKQTTTHSNKEANTKASDVKDDKTEMESSTVHSSDLPSSKESQSKSPQAAFYSVPGKYGRVIIVNKMHPLSPSYAPGEDPVALVAFQSLLAAMRAQGFAVSDAYSGFRSYETQANLYNAYVARDGQSAADRYSARPGYSEHQTGLAFDILDASGRLLEEPIAASWLSQNAHQFGFVVRYPPGKEAITGYMPESWHIRYVGEEASDIHYSGLTLEEYYGVPGGSY